MSLKYIVGNWKMNGTVAAAQDFAAGLFDRLQNQTISFCTKKKIILCLPFPYLLPLLKAVPEGGFEGGGQDCSPHLQGAYTGDISAGMLRDVGCHFVLVGHSERRQHHLETNNLVKKKAEAALEAGLKVILCVGETLAQREAEEAEITVTKQVLESLPAGAAPNNLLIAYEPVWAIGTSLTPTSTQIQDMHSHLRKLIKRKQTYLLYGGSVTPQNAVSILNLPNVDGVLVGGASLRIDDFWGIIKSE